MDNKLEHRPAYEGQKAIRCVEVNGGSSILTEWAFQCYSEGMIGKLVENDEEATNDAGKLEMLLKVAIWCVQEEPMLRPSMRIVTMMLKVLSKFLVHHALSYPVSVRCPC
ncbi:hypothetical protein F3Y22_tig00111445pilonHSYRG00047 [Hibiscus syriacus]|uniref:Uncharacterized protein n=1 Tax=Hibiscus syriacus TaxID=106335 RepID=A0A6A2XR39_HIBSY|nr:hypothetical protein F3Y22_tig00111445pilonHSYRG00047 [Hibiscus syriacus]